MPRKLRQLITLAFVVLPLVLTPFAQVSARSLDDIQAEISAQNAELAKIQQQIKDAEKTMKGLQSSIAAGQGELPRLQNEIAQIEQTLQINTLQSQALADQQKIKQLEEEQRVVNEDRAVKGSYMDWRIHSATDGIYLFTGELHPMKVNIYQSTVMDTEQGGIEALAAQLDQIKTDLANFQSQSQDLQSQSADLKRRKEIVQAQILAMQHSLNATNGQVAGLRGQSVAVMSKISQLSAEQKALQDYEAWILGQSGNGGTKDIPSGQLYFTGRGRDMYQGHGVGFSQFGAYGAALKGWSASQIINLYYANVSIATQPGTITVSGYGAMDINTYAAGQNEIPSKACGTAAQIAARPDKYVKDNPNTVWDCWPEESIKAFMMVYRSYGLYYQQHYGPICTSTSCQVYLNNHNSQWAADETKDMVIVSRGYSDTNQVIQALYSSDNNNGWGTSNNDTRFSNFAGDGTPISYLRAVNDSATTYHYQYTDWTYHTDGYTLNPVAGAKNSIKGMLDFAAQDSQISSSSRAFVADVRNQVGTLAAVNFDRDPSGRVRKVIFVGTNGASRTVAGWFFKTIWNSWIDQVQPNGEKDFIYSPTYFLLTK